MTKLEGCFSERKSSWGSRTGVGQSSKETEDRSFIEQFPSASPAARTSHPILPAALEAGRIRNCGVRTLKLREPHSSRGHPLVNDGAGTPTHQPTQSRVLNPSRYCMFETHVQVLALPGCETLSLSWPQLPHLYKQAGAHGFGEPSSSTLRRLVQACSF